MSSSQQLYKGSLTTIILALMAQHPKMYGYQITKEVAAQSNGQFKLTEGALYPALHKLESEGWLQVTIETVGNRQRKYYQLTDPGKKEARRKVVEFNHFVQQLQRLLQPNVSI